MEVRFLCPFCGRRLKPDEEAVGEAVDCPDCGKELLVPFFESQATPPPLPPPVYTAPLEVPALPQPKESGEYTCPVCWLPFDRGDESGPLRRLNLAAHGLEGETKHGGNINSHYDDPHDATGRFDFVLANPPFNFNAVNIAMRASARRLSEGTPQGLPERQDHERLKDMAGLGSRFPFGLPRTDNANYLWIQLSHSALNDKGRAGFVMASSASDTPANRLQ